MEQLSQELINEMTGPGMYRVIEVSFGFSPQQYYQTKEGPLWIPLLKNGYWADPDAYSTGEVTVSSIMPHEDAERAVWLAKKINHERGEGPAELSEFHA
jgi:hypothetical protein